MIFNEIKKYILLNVNEFEEWRKEQNKPWKFIGWYSPQYNNPNTIFIIKKNKCLSENNKLSIWIIMTDKSGLKYRYNVYAKDEQSLKILLNK